jgi:hypothetical protein
MPEFQWFSKWGILLSVVKQFVSMDYEYEYWPAENEILRNDGRILLNLRGLFQTSRFSCAKRIKNNR